MVTKLSTKGQVVLPGPMRRKLGLRPGDLLAASLENGRILLTPQKKTPAFEAKIVYDPVTGLPALDAGPDAPMMTHEQVKEMLADFP
jgi:AbrB family looped-hinge helix DNA binding protein